MNMKSKIVGLALAASVMLTGAGYALGWEDTVFTNVTAKTGYLDVAFDQGAACFEGTNKHVESAVTYAKDTEGNGQNRWDVANVKFTNLHPGAKVKFELKVDNLSTIPVELANVPTIDVPWADGEKLTIKRFNQNGVEMGAGEGSGEEDITATSEGCDITRGHIPVGGYATFTYEMKANEVDEQATYTYNTDAKFIQYNGVPHHEEGGSDGHDDENHDHE